MKSISSLGCRFYVLPLQEALRDAEWDRHRWRTEHPRSPHREASDIWLRYNAIENFGPTFNDEHESVWYPDIPPEGRALAEDVAAQFDAIQLGGVLLTKVPAGKQIYPHIDRGWHAEHYEKLAVLIEGNLEQSFCFADGEFRCEPGDAFTFNNQDCHWVLNPTDEDRVTLIVCVRRH